jgi:hypothetical protein
MLSLLQKHLVHAQGMPKKSNCLQDFNFNRARAKVEMLNEQLYLIISRPIDWLNQI